MLKIILYCSQENEFENQKSLLRKNGFSEETLVFGNSNTKTREQLINENLNFWLLFLDHDCVPNSKTRSKILSIAKDSPNKSAVYAGVYENPEKANSLQKAHNKIANTWVEQSYEGPGEEPCLLGGFFLIAATSPVPVPQVKFWGAEDKLLAQHLRKAGYQFHFSKELKAIHYTSKKFGHFVRRAFLHGRNDEIYFKKNESSRIFYWIRKIEFLDLRLMPLILLHFCIQKGAKAFQKALPKNKQ